MKIINCEQRSPEWFAVRCGIPSASNFDKIITNSGQPSKQREKYLYTLAGEILSGKKQETYTSFAMQQGIEREGEAREYYELIRNIDTQQVGFCMNSICGCSPDGLIGEDGGLEIKCPELHTQISYMLNDEELEYKYFQQVQGSLFVTERKWWDLMSYFPGLDPVIVRVEPDEMFHKALKTELDKFVKDLQALVKKLKK